MGSFPRYLLAGLAGAAVTLLCLIPPVLHFVTGPLGPVIGGVAAVMLVKPPAGCFFRPLLAGPCIGVTAGLLFVSASAILLRLREGWVQEVKFIQGRTIDFQDLMVIGGCVIVYVSLLAAIGVWVGNKVSRG